MSYLLKPMSYVLVIVLGYTLKRIGFLKREDQRVLARIMFNVTLPSTIIQGFAGFERDASLFLLAILGFFFALTPVIYMYATSDGAPKELRAYRMINASGYNVGCFSLPLIEAFFGSTGVVVACLFDAGNAVVMTAGVYAITSALLKTDGKRESGKDVLMKFLGSIPFDTYMIMFALTLLNVTIPGFVFELTRPAGQANGFLAMMIIGIMFEPMGDKALIKETAREMAHRMAFSAMTAALCYFVLPYSLIVRQTLVVLCFAPLTSLGPINTERCGGNATMASFTNSVSIVLSLICMMAFGMAFIA